MDHDRIGRSLPRGLDQTNLGDSIDCDIRQRVGLAAHMAGLRGEVEDDRSALTQGPQVKFADVATNKVHVGTVEVARIGAPAEQEAIQRGDLSASGRKGMAKIGAEKPRPTRDEDFLT